jgi:hypothetical protein
VYYYSVSDGGWLRCLVTVASYDPWFCTHSPLTTNKADQRPEVRKRPPVAKNRRLEGVLVPLHAQKGRSIVPRGATWPRKAA